MTTTDAPNAQPAVAGQLRDTDGALPLTAVDIETEIRGLTATTTVRQRFRNTRTVSIEATYIFPLPDRAGVTAFTADLAGRVIEADLRERAAARAAYDEAVAAGHRAAIAEQERPDVFSIRAGNLQPGEEAVVTLTLTGPLPVDDGTAEYRFPLVVAPRYIAGEPLGWPPVGEGTAADTDAVPDASRITPPVLLPGLASPVRLSLRARIAGLGLAPGDIRSSLHAVSTAVCSGDVIEVSLHPGERLNRDVVLRFGAAAATARTLAVASADDEDATAGTWQVTVVPPAAALGPAGAGRDVVVVLDRSGSMGGWKMTAARRAAARVIDSLGTRDSFAVLAFDHTAEHPPELGDSLVPATDRSRWTAVSWLAGLEARGGTEMLQPLSRAAATLAAAEGAGRDRFLVLVTDGQVGGEDQILAAVAPAAASTRIFALGIDQAVNAGFLRRLAAAGAGRCELVESQDRLDDVMTALHRRISPPVVTGLRVEADGVELTGGQTTPARADLFPGAPCTLAGRWRAASPPAALTLTVSGDGGFAEQVTAAVAPDRAVRACWARARVADLEDSYAAGSPSPQLAEQIVAVSLQHRVLSRFTAFVAVDRSRHTDLGTHQPVLQPAELPAGWAAGGQQVFSGLRRGAVDAGVAGAPPPGRFGPMSLGTPSDGGRRVRAAAASAPAGGRQQQTVPAAAPAPLIPLEGYVRRAGELIGRIERDLEAGHDLAAAAEAIAELAGDLASVAAPQELISALRDLARALRSSGDPRQALAAARQAVAQAPGTARPAAPGPVPPDRQPPSRRSWWR